MDKNRVYSFEGDPAIIKKVLEERNILIFGETKIISIFAIPNQERYFSRGGKQCRCSSVGQST